MRRAISSIGAERRAAAVRERALRCARARAPGSRKYRDSAAKFLMNRRLDRRNSLRFRRVPLRARQTHISGGPPKGIPRRPREEEEERRRRQGVLAGSTNLFIS